MPISQKESLVECSFPQRSPKPIRRCAAALAQLLLLAIGGREILISVGLRGRVRLNFLRRLPETRAADGRR